MNSDDSSSNSIISGTTNSSDDNQETDIINDDEKSISSTESISSNDSSDDGDDDEINDTNKNHDNSIHLLKIESNSYITCLKNNKELGMIGKAKIELYTGRIDVYGYTLSSSENVIINDIASLEQYYQEKLKDGAGIVPNCFVYNTIYLPIISIRSNMSIFKVIFECTEYTIFDNTNSILVQNKSHEKNNLKDMSLMHIPPSWGKTADTLLTNQKNKQRMLICGMEGSGKKLLLGYIINRLLSRQPEQSHSKNKNGDDEMSTSSNEESKPSVYILDVNVEHPSTNLPGIVTLSSTTCPFLSPPYTRISNKSIKLEYASFYGYKRPKDNPDKYRSCIQSCMDYYHHLNQDAPLVVITHGWVHRIGYDIILPSVIQTINPNVILQLGNTFLLSKNILQKYTHHYTLEEYYHEYLCTTNEQGNPIQPILKKYTNPFKNSYFIMEVFLFTSYFLNGVTNKLYNIIGKHGKIRDKSCYIARVLASMRPTVISYYAIDIIIDNENYDHPEPTQNRNYSKDEIYKILNGSLIGLLSSSNSCIGLGIIRSIDPMQDLLFILTPLSLKELENVRSICKFDNVSIPFPLLRLGYNNNCGGDSIARSQPFVQHSIINNTGFDGGRSNKKCVGDKAMRSRKHWNRKAD